MPPAVLQLPPRRGEASEVAASAGWALAAAAVSSLPCCSSGCVSSGRRGSLTFSTTTRIASYTALCEQRASAGACRCVL